MSLAGGLSRELLIYLAWTARKNSWALPRGKRDSAGRWYPNDEEGKDTPDVRKPSRLWPSSYYSACKSKIWVSRLPENTLVEDAEEALKYFDRIKFSKKFREEIVALKLAI